MGLHRFIRGLWNDEAKRISKIVLFLRLLYRPGTVYLGILAAAGHEQRRPRIKEFDEVIKLVFFSCND